MTYQEALRYLKGTNRAFCKPGTDRVRALCDAFGNPEKDLPVIHVTGTNGKGSFCAILSSLLSAMGFRVGRFSSPALERINECIVLGDHPISDEAFAEGISRLRPVADRQSDRPTEFELLTVAAFLYFREQNCDYVLLECGMGGETDATNVIDRPLLSVITGIALDHASFLGNTVEEIARHKAGILKPHCLALWCGTDRRAEAVIRAVAEERHAALFTVPRETLKIRSADLRGTVFDFDGMDQLPLPLLGLYQAENAANALTALKLLECFPDRKTLTDGLFAARWKGRFEILAQDPLLIADGGHNPQGIAGALESIRAYFPEEKVIFVTGIMADKDYNTVAAMMSPVAETVYTVTPPNPRALPASEYAEVFRGLGVSAVPCHTVTEAVSAARREGKPTICLGSLYMYGEIRAALEQEKA